MLFFVAEIAFFLNSIVAITYYVALYDGGVTSVIRVTLFFVK